MPIPHSSTPAPSPIARALTLSERLAILREHPRPPPDTEWNLPSGRRWVDKLKAMPPFDQLPHLWERFLAAHQLTEDGLLHALGAPEAFLAAHAGEAGRWAEELEEALAAPPREAAPAFDWPSSMSSQAKLLTFSAPVIAWALARIQRGLASLEAEGGSPLLQPGGVEALFLPRLASTAYAITHRTLVLELNVSRLSGELTGTTPTERFESFVARLADPTYARTLHEEYAVLSRQLVESVRAIADFCVLFLRHLVEDRSALRGRFFGGDDPGLLTQVLMSGDGHRGGKRVLVLEFEGGRKLIYKPHSLRVDEHFQSLLRWLNARGHQPPLRTMACLDRGDHGWTEFIAVSDCSSEEELRRFYLRQGGLLAVLYAMLATDFHYENLIASGEYPVLVDLESLFHPTLHPSGESELDEAIRGAMNYSVLRTALLPTPQLMGNSDVPVDLSGLSDVEGQQSPQAAPYVNMAVADEAHIDRMKLRMLGSQNIPTLRGTKPDPSAYTEEIAEGFTRMYGLLLAHREALLAPEGPVRRFAGDDIRFIFRTTRTYALLSRETLHPDLQRDALDRERHFLRLWALLEERQDIASLITSELESLWKGDVPFFHTRTDSVDLSDHEDRRHPDLLNRSCLEEVLGHIRRLDEGDLKRQAWFIRGAMACHRAQARHMGAGAKEASFRPVSTAEGLPSRSTFLQEACRVGDRLVELAMRGRSDEAEGATWIGMVLVSEKVWQFLPLGIDLYDGLPGITLFLAHLAKASGERKYADLARGALTVIRQQQRQSEKNVLINGAFGGWGGLIYLYTHLSHLWEEPLLLEEALQCARHASARAGEDEECDLIYGNAGAILALHGLYELHPAAEVLEAMRECGQRLLSQAHPMAQGLGWSAKVLECVPLAGYSHGASGIASALEVLFRRTGQQAWLEAAAAALAYERTLFSPEHGNWLDVRLHRPDRKEEEPLPPPNYPTAWCNGAPGIGLSRFRMPSLDDAAARAEVEAALANTRLQGFGYNHSLCHGDLGNLELLLEARQAGHPLLEENEVERYAAGILEGIRHKGWICGTPAGIETPGLLTGLAGIGYGFLRLADPAGTPSILLLDPPR
jgi:type 2 lantibiotic biosynthesis protein LanM